MTEAAISNGPNNLSGGASGAIIIDYHHLWSGGDGMRPYGIVLCRLPHNQYDPFVTWRAYYDESEDAWFAEVGHYHNNIFDAVNDYKVRIERG